MMATPSDELLMKYASGVLDPALQLLLDRHFDLHPPSKARLAVWQEFGGALLAGEPGSALTPGSLDRALSRLGDPTPAPQARSHFPAIDQLPWRWAGPGRAIANIEIPGSALKSYAFRIAPGKAMLQHSHAGEEWTLIVQGAYRDEGGEYATGAFIEEDEETNHRPIATGDMDCICLAVMSGPLSAPGIGGTVARWMMR